MTIEISKNKVVFDGQSFTPEETEAVFRAAKEYSNFIQTIRNEGA